MSPNVEQLPGVGPQLATRIREHFGTDDAFFDAARNQDLQAIRQVEGLTDRRAVDLVLAARGDHTPERFLATPAARKVHDRIMERLLSYASTDVGRNRLRLLHPLPSAEAAASHVAEVLAAKTMTADTDPPFIQGALRRLRPPAPPAPRLTPGLLVVAESDAVHSRLHAKDLGRWATLGGPRDLQEAHEYEVVVVAYDDGLLDTSGLDNAVDVHVDAGEAMLCPDRVLVRFEAMRTSIQACQDLATRFHKSSIAAKALELMNQQSAANWNGADLRAVVDAIKSDLDLLLAERVADCQLTGPALLQAVADGTLPPAIQRIVDDVLEHGRQELHKKTGMRFQPFTASYPLRVDDDEMERVVQSLAADAHRERFEANQRTATALLALEADVVDEIRHWLDFDATYALGRFAVDHDLHAPSFSTHLRFDHSIHLDLAGDPSAQRIRYELGGDSRAVVLTGANSGGKSTLLEHLTQLAVMARMGLPVVGENVEVPWLDEVHLVTARRGMDAGAFETFLRGFLPVTKGDAKRLVLADEVEAVTELDAAARILAWVLDRLQTTESLAVVVTHLAEQVLQHVDPAAVRVDGIEATGLDDQHQLVVNRCPVMGRGARSTPELIVQRLAATTRGTEQSLYQDLLSVFDAPNGSTSHA